jgi:hypothetical protein
VGLIAMVAIGLAFCTLPIYGVTLSPFLGAICFILLWSCAAAAAVFSSYRRLFDLCTFVIGGRLVVVYFEIFGSMVATGLGLILTGVMILAVVYAWYKYRGQAFKWLEAP